MSDDLAYALVVTGGGTFFFIAWWLLCFTIRNGIDGTRAMVAFLHSRKKHKWRKIMIGGWR